MPAGGGFYPPSGGQRGGTRPAEGVFIPRRRPGRAERPANRGGAEELDADGGGFYPPPTVARAESDTTGRLG